MRSVIDGDKALDVDAQKEIYVQQALDKAFVLQGNEIRTYVQESLLKTGSINSRHLNATTMQELLNLAHAIEVGTLDNLSSRFKFIVQQDEEWLHSSPQIQDDHYFKQRDQFVISLIDEEKVA